MDTMKFEFTDGRTINVEGIYGSPQLIHGSMRDTLQIEINPNNINFNSLKALFSEPSNLETIYSISVHQEDELSDPIETRTEIGTGYTILVSITNEYRQTSPVPGTWEQPKIEELYIVVISQETYAEHQLRLLNSNNE